MNFHLKEVSVHNLHICYGAFGIALYQVKIFFHAENGFVAVERVWSNTLKIIKTIELLALPVCVCVMVVIILEKSCCTYLLTHKRYMHFQSQKTYRKNVEMTSVFQKKCTKRLLSKTWVWNTNLIRCGAAKILCD